MGTYSVDLYDLYKADLYEAARESARETAEDARIDALKGIFWTEEDVLAGKNARFEVIVSQRNWNNKKWARERHKADLAEARCLLRLILDIREKEMH